MSLIIYIYLYIYIYIYIIFWLFFYSSIGNDNEYHILKVVGISCSRGSSCCSSMCRGSSCCSSSRRRGCSCCSSRRRRSIGEVVVEVGATCGSRWISWHWGLETGVGRPLLFCTMGTRSPCWLFSSPLGVHPVRIFWSLRTHWIEWALSIVTQTRARVDGVLLLLQR